MSGGPGRPRVAVATSNPGKLREIREILGGVCVELVGLEDLPPVRFCEEGEDYEANARAKALSAAEQTGLPALAEDSGLEVDGLSGAPGPRSARYGGSGLDDAGRVARLLRELRGSAAAARCARFVCWAALASPDGRVETARGQCPGHILEKPVGRAGFGYDPVFAPEGEGGRSMAQLSAAEKNRISHRARALRGLAEALARLR